MRHCPGSLIRDDANDPDPAYRVLRDNPKRSADREFAEKLWSTYWPYADAEFYTDLPRDFTARFWEMDLACELLGLRFALEQRSRHGPDICISPPDHPVWIEAVAPTDGVGANASPDLIYEEPVDGSHVFQAHTFSGERGLILRFRQAIEEKFKKCLDYRDAAIIGPRDPYVIALNGSRVSASIVAGDLPWIVKAVYPFGDTKLHLDLKTETFTAGHDYQPTIQTAAGSEVAVDIFLRPEYSGISGILFSRADVWNRRDDYIFVHNLKAANPLDRGWLAVGTEYWPDSEALHLTRHTTSPSG